jgi:hypothetical protein
MHAKQCLREAHARQAMFANQHRRELTFRAGDKVRLATTNINLPSTMTKKFAPKFLGPYTVRRVVNPVTYELKLPPTLKIHPVFHVSLLQPWNEDVEFDHPDPHNCPPPVVPEDNQYRVEALTDKRVRRVGRNRYITQYLVRWKGYGCDEDSWVNAKDIESSLIAEYESTHHAAIPVTTRSTRKSTRRRTAHAP